MNKGQIEKRKEYMEYIKVFYGIRIEEYRMKGGQKCGYFHITFPIFIPSQAPGDKPVGFKEPVTEYTEARMRYVINHKLYADEWYLMMCREWMNNNPSDDLNNLVCMTDFQEV